MNFLKWDNFVEKNEGGGRHWHMKLGRKGENFDDSVEVVKDYIRNRFAVFGVKISGINRKA